MHDLRAAAGPADQAPIHVTVASPEEALLGVAEFWASGELIGFTRIEDGDLTLRIGPSRDGVPVIVGAQGLAEALAEVNRLLGQYCAKEKGKSWRSL